MRALLLLFVALTALPAVPLSLPDADCELPDRGPWQLYGTPTAVEKVATPRSGQRALRVVTDNQQVMYKYEGVSRNLGRLEVGERLRLRVWLRPQAGSAVLIAIGRTSFEGVWQFTDSDWFEAVCDFRCTVAGEHRVWISQMDAPAEFLVDDLSVDRSHRLRLPATPAEHRLSLTSAGLQVQFDRRNGALCGLRNLTTGESLLADGAAQPTFALERLAADGRSYEPLGFERAQLRQLLQPAAERLVLRYDLPADQLAVECRWEVVAAELRGQISVTNRAAAPVLAVTFPLVQEVAPASDPANLVLVDPYLCGRITRQALRGGCETAFPGRGVMGWLDLSGERGGVALHCEDRTWTGTRLTALPAGERTFDLSLTPEVVISQGATWTSATMVVQLHAGDWHAAADRYRAWLTSWQPAPDLPEWLRHCNGWVLTGCQNGIAFRRLPDIYRSAEWMGCDYLHVQGQHIDGLWYDQAGQRGPAGYSLPLPNPALGGAAGFTAAVRRIHQRGGKVMGYFLYDRFCPALLTAEHLGGGTRTQVGPTWRLPPPSFFPENALLQRPGERPPTDHGVAMQRMMSLASRGWQDWMHYWGVEVYARRLGTEGMYWDVMGRNGPFRCFNAAAGQHGENAWAQGCAALLERLIRDGRAINPDYSASIEGCSAALRPWVGFHLMSGATQQPEVFRYTLPDVLLVDGFSNHTWKWTHLEKARRVYLAGERFDLHGYDARVKPMIQLREQLRAFTDPPALFRDTVGLTASDPRVEARWFLRDDGLHRAAAVTVLNEAGLTDATLTLDAAPLTRPAAVWRAGLDGRLEPLAVEFAAPGRLRLPVAADTLSGFLIVERLGPELTVLPQLRQVFTPGSDALELTLWAPLGTLPATAVEVRGAGPTWTAAAPPTAPTPGLQRQRFTPAGGLAALTDWTRVTAVVRWGQQQASAWCSAAPPLINGDYETLEDGTLIGWGCEPDRAERHAGQASLRLDNNDGRFLYTMALTPLKPATRYRLSGWIKRRGSPAAHVSLALVEYEEGSQLRVACDVGSRGQQDRWEEFSAEFTSHPGPRSSAVYLYNRGGTGSAWFDDLRLEEVKG
ncbi:MAG: hypothetical protein IT204_16800 [Fimbriimonadaceae bacterium]|nr:hypothetical protein [Fimbriimonadaceae bacterium]